MKRNHYAKVGVAALAGAGLLLAGSQAAMAEGDFLGGKFKLDLRYRYETVDQDGFSEDATASTLRTRVNYSTEELNGWKLFIEADNVLELGADEFNSGAGTSSPRRNIYPVVADHDYTEINQAYLNYAFNKGSSIRVGRQRILLDNQRYVGGVGWRQNEQTYDGASIKNKIGEGTLFYAYVYNVNRIFGSDVPAGDHEQSTHLLNYSWSMSDKSKLTFYYYNIDNDDAAAFSTSTFGASYKGKAPLSNERSFNWGVEFATQDDASNNPVDYTANYIRLDAEVKFTAGFTGFVGWESLEGDSTRGGAMFRTPLATLHAFNGWADRFLGTPEAGLNDLFLGAKGKLGKANWQVIWHEFEAQSGSADFGSELDASVGFKPSKRTGLLLKAAFLDGDQGAPDVTKIWIMLTAKF